MTEDCIYGKIYNCPYLEKCNYATGFGVFPIDFERKHFHTPSEIFDMLKKLENDSIVWVDKSQIVSCLPHNGKGKKFYREKLEKLLQEFNKEILNNEKMVF